MSDTSQLSGKSFSELEADFGRLLSFQMPTASKRIRTFFDIAGLSTGEVAISNLYEYYFSLEETTHSFQKLFISSLLELITEKTGKSNFSADEYFRTRRELKTKEGFIDLLLTEEQTNSNIKPKNAIIIENKINHRLENDLEDYVNSVDVSDTRIGILLTPYDLIFNSQNTKLNENNKKLFDDKVFVHIKHRELVDRIETKLGPHLVQSDTWEILLLKEFLQNIKNLENQMATQDMYKFYLTHINSIKGVVTLSNEMRNYIFEQIKNACSELGPSFKIYGENRAEYRYFVLEGEPDVYFTVGHEENTNKIWIILELNSNGIELYNKLNIYDKLSESKSKRLPKERSIKVRKSHHLASESVYFNNDDYNNVAILIKNEIQNTGLEDLILEISRIFKLNRLSNSTL